MRKRIITTAALAALTLWIVSDDEAAAPQPASTSARHEVRSAPVAAPSLLDETADHTGIVERVTADRTKLCAGEDALVTAHVADDVEVHINGARANPAIVRYGQPGTYRVRVRARGERDGARVDGTGFLSLEFVSCPDKPQLWAVARSGGSPETVEGMIVLQRGLRGRVRYAWDFGDGTSEDGARTHTHTYEVDRSKPRVGYIIKVTATDEAGTTLTARAHYAFRTEAARLASTE